MSYPSPQQPAAIKIINRLGRGLKHIGLSAPSLSAEKLVLRAQQQTGLSDFGDASFKLGLDKLSESLSREAKLSQIGRIAAHAMLLDNLKIRLQLTEYRKHRPEVAQQKIVRPVFVLGLPRTGTTILYELLAQDPDHRAPMSWEVSQPLPPAQQQSFKTDSRIASTEKELQKTEMLAPGFKAIHEIGAELPQECVAILAAHFISDQYGATFSIPDYRLWSLGQDMSAAYSWHYQFLQHMQVDYMKQRWVLKTPPHLAYLDTLIKQYPDAAIIQTHRDPMDVIGSISSLACTLHGAFSDDIDPIATGRCELDFFSKMLNQGMQGRYNIPDQDSRFYDVKFNELISDPISIIEKIYEHFDFTFTADARLAMQRYLDNRPRDKHGRHQYTLEKFGLSREKHSHVFSEYCQRFDL